MLQINHFLMTDLNGEWSVGRTNIKPFTPTKGYVAGEMVTWIVAPHDFISSYRSDWIQRNKDRCEISDLLDRDFDNWLTKQAILAWVDAHKSSLLS